MKLETTAIHAGYESEPTTHAVAVPIYQTVAYEFDNAQHGADLFNLAVPGNIYTRIMNPTNDVLEQRVAQMEGGVAALALSSGQAAINYSILNLAEAGNNIVTVPQLYGGTWTLFRHMLPKQGIDVRFADDDSPEAPGETYRQQDLRRFLRIDRQPGRQYTESGCHRRYGTCARRSRHRGQHGSHTGADVSHRVGLRYRAAFDDEVHGRARHRYRRHSRRWWHLRLDETR